ncbi:thiamine phosphate synthase [Adhaeribacter radiodurans]|uniref:Thiamine phosphate synthase n=1 Tax=Adhaeribacter radiodurans TaxID=2745197 RepID=A0A7L7LEL6_9BACT|nr:thiamine phosphate synthase [Adhaeribacter radiodurans]QMU31223.1 thiamine phosphate synthase [Adhaeribacter radiodurans]
MERIRNISGGLYLIADAGLEELVLREKLEEALQNGVSIVQLYNTENASVTVINKICTLCHSYQVPVLVNNNWHLLLTTLLDGVHFDSVPDNLAEIKNTVKREFYKGITCSNNLAVVQWAHDNQFNYLSFCSLFPSATAGSCEIVHFENIQKARAITHLPFFAAGGINLHNLSQLAELPLNGIAVVSGIMASDNIGLTTQKYLHELTKIS